MNKKMAHIEVGLGGGGKLNIYQGHEKSKSDVCRRHSVGPGPNPMQVYSNHSVAAS